MQTNTTVISAPVALLPLVEPVGSWAELGCDWIKTTADALSIDTVAQMSNQTMLAIGCGMKDSAFFTMSSAAGLMSLGQCVRNGVMSADALMVLASGLNAASAMDRVALTAAEISIGIGDYGSVTSGLLTLATLASKIQQGDMPGIVISAARLIAIVDFAGNPVAMGIVTVVSVTYSAYNRYDTWFSESSSQ